MKLSTPAIEIISAHLECFIKSFRLTNVTKFSPKILKLFEGDMGTKVSYTLPNDHEQLMLMIKGFIIKEDKRVYLSYQSNPVLFQV